MTDKEILDELEQTMSEIREIKSGLASAMTKLNAIQGNLKSDKKEREKKAYDRGYKEGVESGRKDGLIEAWELMKNIVFAQDSHVMVDILGGMTFSEVLLKNTPQEAIAKLKAYEKEKYRIHVGDEVRAEDGTAVFVVTWMSENCICGVDREGKCYSYEPREVCGKTGRRYDIGFSDIEGGEDNEN